MSPSPSHRVPRLVARAIGLASLAAKTGVLWKTPVPGRGHCIYLRVAEIIEGKRQEFLCCIGEKD